MIINSLLRADGPSPPDEGAVSAQSPAGACALLCYSPDCVISGWLLTLPVPRVPHCKMGVTVIPLPGSVWWE